MAGTVTIARGADADTVVVAVAGRWKPGRGMPTGAVLERRLDEAPPVRRVVGDGRGLAGWDSSLVVFLAGALAICRDRGVEADIGGVPEGVRRLLALAQT